MRDLYNIQRLKKVKIIVFCLFIFAFLHFYSYADTIFSDSFSGSYPGSWYIGHDGGGGSYAWAWPNGYAHEYSNPSGGQYYYPNDLHVYMERRYVNLSGYTSATLSFYYIVDTEGGYDFFTVNIRDQYGSWHEMFRTSGAHDLTWVSKTINLDQFAGQSGLYIQFRFDSDSSVSGSPYDGVFIDNFVLTASGVTQPDLVPYQPSGWDDKIVLSANSGTNTTTTIYTGQSTYIDYAILNDGNVSTGGPFFWELWDDTTGERILQGYSSTSLSANSYYLNEDFPWTFTQPGWHNIRLKVDAYNDIDESNENNNEYTRQVYVYSPPTYPDLAPYKPSAWTSEIVLSTISGTNTDTTIYVNYTAYIDYAVVNSGNGDTGVGFYVEMWDDTTGEMIMRRYYSSSLPSGYYYTQQDSQWTFTQAGWHTIRIKVDADNNVSNESNEGNNEFTKQIYVENVLVNYNEIPGASNNPSSVPTYLNDNDMYNIGPAGNGGICFATAITDILAYWDRNPYNGVIYWNLVDHGKAPLTQNVLPQIPGHNQADVRSLVINIGTRYYINNQDQDSIVEDVCNVENNLSFEATFFNQVTSENDKINYFNVIKVEIDVGRPIKAASIGTYFGGPHAIPVIGYKEFTDPSGNEIYIHVNQGDTTSEYVNFFEPSWEGLNLVRIIPEGTPNDHYEYLNGQDDDDQAHAKWLDPEDVYEFRQTHNFCQAGDQDWVKFQAYSGREYTIETKNLGTNCDTIIYLFDQDGFTEIDSDNDGGDEQKASKIVWECYVDGIYYLKVKDVYFSSYGHTTNFDLEINWDILVVPQTPTPISPYDKEYIYTLSPMFEWSAFLDGGNGATQSGYQLRVRCDTDGDTIVYDTGFVGGTSEHAHVYTAGAYVGYEPVSGVIRISSPLEWGKHYHWHVRYLDSNGRWSAWSSNDPDPHQDFYTQLLTYTLNISISPSGGGSVTKNPDKPYYIYYEAVQLTVTPASGYVFSGWSGDASGTYNPLYVIMDSNKTITANFTPITYTLNVSLNPSGSGSVTKNPDKSSYNPNEVVQLTAAPVAGYIFSSWSGSVSSTANPLSVTMDSNKTITANFAPITHTLSVGVNPSDSGSVTKNPDKSAYDYNEVVQLTATPSSGYIFAGWSGDAAGTTNPLSVTMNSDKTITANFAPPGNLSVVPVEDLSSSGAPGGPFTPSSKIFTIRNTGDTSIDFTVTKSAGWITLSNTGQTLAPDQSLSVTVSINDNANSLNIGTYSNSVIFTNTTNGNGNTSRNVELNISEQQSITVTSPNGGESWEAGSTHAITWTTTGSIGNVIIEYSTNNGPPWETIVPAAANTGIYNWTISNNVPDSPNSCLLRISGGYSDGDPRDISDAPFSITSPVPASLRVTTPNAGEKFTVGSVVGITWASNGSIGDVKIEYSVDNGQTWIIIVPSTANDGSFQWTVPDTPSESCLVRISESDKDQGIFDISDGGFSIVPSPFITVTSPIGGETWEVGSNQPITWTSSGIEGNVKIEYSANEGTSWTTIIASAGNTGSFNWNVPNNLSESCLIRVSETDGEPSDMSDGVFSIVPPPSITVISPNGSESWDAGSTQHITWSIAGRVENVTIEYSPDNGANWIIIVPSTDNDGSYDWKVADNPSDNCLVRITESNTDSAASDTSDARFSITPAPVITITSPNGGEKLKAGTTHNITWTSSQVQEEVKIEYSTDNGTTWASVLLSTSNSGSYQWTVPDNPSKDCLIRVSETDGEPSDVSDLAFSIVSPSTATITVTSPNGGEILTVDSIYQVTWTSTGMEANDNVIIEYSTDEGASWIVIEPPTFNSSSYDWVIPDNPSENCLLRISGNDSDEGPSDVSDAVFSIVSESSITVISPNGGESLTAGATHDITWTGTGIEEGNHIRLEYSIDSGNTWKDIIPLTSNSGSYAWAVPDDPSDNCLIRISGSDADEGPADESDSVFSIASAASVKVISPNGGEQWETGSAYDITWTFTGITGNIVIDLYIGDSFDFNIGTVPVDSGKFAWQIPENFTTGEDYKIFLHKDSIEDYSDTVFSITDQDPNHPDFNNDGKVDILWRNYASGMNEVWYMNGAVRTVTGNLPAMTDLNWRIAGTGDFNRDGKVDILWRHNTTGQNLVWYMDGMTLTGNANLPIQPDVNWQIVGTGDFNGDGKDDILWRNALEGRNQLWYLDGVTVTKYQGIQSLEGLAWRIVGAGDFNSDGKTDILWRNYSTGSNEVWYMDGGSRIGSGVLLEMADVSWQLVGLGDFNLDGETDILWRNYSDGKNMIWYMDGVTRIGYEYIETRSDLNWQVVSNGDYKD